MKTTNNLNILNTDALIGLKQLDSNSVDCIVTSPPYWALRDYGVEGQLGLENTFEEYIEKLCNIFDEAKRVLKPTGTCWVVLGDTYGGSGDKGNYKDPKNPNGRNGQKIAVNKSTTPKCICLIPERFAIEMIHRGWILRNQIIWEKPNCMPSSASDRFTVDFEKVFFFVKKPKYNFKQQYEELSKSSISRLKQNIDKQKGSSRVHGGMKLNGNMKACGDLEKGRNKRTTWSINTQGFKGAHFAVYPEKLVEPMIKAGCPEGGIVLDPFAGAGTTGLVALKQNKKAVLIELNPDYVKIIEKRLKGWSEQRTL